MKYVPFRTLVVYKTKEYAYNWVNDFFKEYCDAMKEVVEKDVGWDIILRDESVIALRPAMEPFIGERFHRIYVDSQIDDKFVDEILCPICLNARIIYD
jgi:hypothetical protein